MDEWQVLMKKYIQYYHYRQRSKLTWNLFLKSHCVSGIILVVLIFLCKGVDIRVNCLEYALDDIKYFRCISKYEAALMTNVATIMAICILMLTIYELSRQYLEQGIINLNKFDEKKEIEKYSQIKNYLNKQHKLTLMNSYHSIDKACLKQKIDTPKNILNLIVKMAYNKEAGILGLSTENSPKNINKKNKIKHINFGNINNNKSFIYLCKLISTFIVLFELFGIFLIIFFLIFSIFAVSQYFFGSASITILTCACLIGSWILLSLMNDNYLMIE